MLQCTVAHCNTLQHAATRCNTLQHTATHCNTLQHPAAALDMHASIQLKASLPLCIAHTIPEASLRRFFDPCTPLFFDLYHYLEQNGYFCLVPEHAPGPSSQVIPGCRVRHPCSSKKLFVRHKDTLTRVKHQPSVSKHFKSLLLRSCLLQNPKTTE